MWKNPTLFLYNHNIFLLPMSLTIFSYLLAGCFKTSANGGVLITFIVLLNQGCMGERAKEIVREHRRLKKFYTEGQKSR